MNLNLLTEEPVWIEISRGKSKVLKGLKHENGMIKDSDLPSIQPASASLSLLRLSSSLLSSSLLFSAWASSSFSFFGVNNFSLSSFSASFSASSFWRGGGGTDNSSAAKFCSDVVFNSPRIDFESAFLNNQSSSCVCEWQPATGYGYGRGKMQLTTRTHTVTHNNLLDTGRSKHVGKSVSRLSTRRTHKKSQKQSKSPRKQFVHEANGLFHPRVHDQRMKPKLHRISVEHFFSDKWAWWCVHKISRRGIEVTKRAKALTCCRCQTFERTHQSLHIQWVGIIRSWQLC